jgi:hypothetical protein
VGREGVEKFEQEEVFNMARLAATDIPKLVISPPITS